MLKIVIERADKIYSITASEIKKVMENTNRPVLALPTGNTPTSLYRLLSVDKTIDWSKVVIFMLDCYYPQDKNDPLSFYTYIKNNLLDNINLPPENFHMLDSQALNPEQECLKYEKEIQEAGGLDLAILGLGENCHIAFCEPGTPQDSLTHVTNISTQTILVNNVDKVENFPTKALTVGIKTILSARKIMVLAKGEKKALSVKRSLTENPSAECPASFLQNHPNITYMLDSEAAALL
ncbi:glucosamine-6-phosphate deaminase [Candidatus Microgenomates bacterium]|nr:glucosamine-6-phosphate deaminase [Candidatus Microgenomates bacterium]